MIRMFQRQPDHIELSSDTSLYPSAFHFSGRPSVLRLYGSFQYGRLARFQAFLRRRVYRFRSGSNFSPDLLQHFFQDGANCSVLFRVRRPIKMNEANIPFVDICFQNVIERSQFSVRSCTDSYHFNSMSGVSILHCMDHRLDNIRFHNLRRRYNFH